jgi:hypothetical protein
LLPTQVSQKLPALGLAVARLLARIRTWQVFVLALALRLPIAWLRPLEPHVENIKAGFTLARHGYLGDPFSLPTGPTAHVSPAYPALVAAVRTITPSDDACVRALSMILAVVTSCNIAALIPISRALKLPRESGTVAAFIWLIPFFTWIELAAEFETPLVVAALLALVTLVARSIASPPGITTGARLGFAAGVAAHVTPMVLPVTAFAALVAARFARWRVKGLLAVTAGAAVAFAVAILPYTLRNHHAFGAWFFMRDNFGLELAMSNGPNALVTKDENSRVGGTLAHHPFSARSSAASLRELGEVEYNHRLQSAAFTWMRENPLATLKLVGARLVYMVLPHGTRWYQSVIACAVSLLSITGGVLLWRSRYKFGIRCLAAAIGGYLLVYLLVEHDIRYMYPALVLESLIAGAFLIVILRACGAAPSPTDTVRARDQRGE